MVKAIENKRYTQVKKTDKLIRKALLKNRENAIACSTLTLQGDEIDFINSLSAKLK
ncbi:MAG: hypothetical protein IJN96_05360 [Clostridia bacterium]|nr:hypothetical protein [Clostridia bacterium]